MSPVKRLLPLLLGAWASACGPAQRSTPPPPPPPGFAEMLPPDAPLTAVLRPTALTDGLRGLPVPAPPHDPTRSLGGLGIDPDGPVWLALRAGPVLGVLRAAEDAERVLADVDPIADPRLMPGELAGPFDRWLRAHPLPPAWIHLRLVGRPAGGPTGPVTPEAWLSATQGALATVRAADPAETLAAALETESGPAGAIQAALAAHRPTVYRLLDRPLPTAVVVHRRGGAHPAVVVDVLWDRDLGAGGLAAAMAALPEAGGAWSERRAALFGWPAEDELLRLELHHGGWLAAARMLREVQALQTVVGQGPTPAGARARLVEGRIAARLPERLGAPVAPALVATTLTVVRGADDLRVRLAADTRSPALAALRDGTAPVDHGVAADALRDAGEGMAVTLGQPPSALARVLGPHVGPPDRPLTALLTAIERCGPACAPAAWSVLAYGRDLPATVATASGHAPLEAALAASTGLARVAVGGSWAAAVGHRAPATLDRAAWAPIVETAGLESRWVIGDRAVLLAGRGPALEALSAAARSPAISDAAALRFTVMQADGLRLDGALSFERQGVVLDAVLDRPAPPR